MKKHEELPEDHVDPLMQYLHHAIRFAIKILAVLMVLVIFWSIADVVYVLYMRLSSPPYFLLGTAKLHRLFI